jgi:hypothetical protein
MEEKNQKQFLYIFIMAICILLLLYTTGCGRDDSSSTTEDTIQSTSSTETGFDTTFSDKDMDTSYDEAESTIIILSNNASSVDGAGAKASGSTVTISEEGTYILSGTLTDGQLIIDAEDSADIHIVFNGVSISSSTTAPVLIKEADKVVITLAEGSENEITDTAHSEMSVDGSIIDAAIFSKADLAINGEGILVIEGNYEHGIASKDDLIITGGCISVAAAGDGLQGKDCVKVAGGTLSIQAETDGIQSDNEEDDYKGYIYIQDANITIKAGDDGFQAKNTLIISGGEISIASDDDALHSNGDVSIEGGILEIACEDDGVHADNALVVNGGEINIENSYEGLEGNSIDINGGTIHVNASDDGFNAAGGQDNSQAADRREADNFQTDSDSYIKISGGMITINASGDGIDSNGTLTVSGGETYVSGPTTNGNGALDYNGNATISAGVIIAAGSTGMAEGFSASSTQYSILYNFNMVVSANTTISLINSSGDTILSYTPEKEYQSVVLSSAQLAKGTYTLKVGTQSYDIEISSIVTTYDSNGGGMNNQMIPNNETGGPNRNKQ